MKTLKFRPHLCREILQGKKTTTWRLFDDKGIVAKDVIALLDWETGKEFGTAMVTSAKETTLGDLEDSDWDGHERFPSEEELYRTYSLYYKRPVGKDTPVKIIRFRLL